MATQGWCADRLGDWLKRNPTKGPKDCKEKLEGIMVSSSSTPKHGQA